MSIDKYEIFKLDDVTCPTRETFVDPQCDYIAKVITIHAMVNMFLKNDDNNRFQ